MPREKTVAELELEEAKSDYMSLMKSSMSQLESLIASSPEKQQEAASEYAKKDVPDNTFNYITRLLYISRVALQSEDYAVAAECLAEINAASENTAMMYANFSLEKNTEYLKDRTMSDALEKIMMNDLVKQMGG